MSTIVITGSSSGMGKATAKFFAKKGWTVVATMRSPEKETELLAYDNVHLYPLDITNVEQVKSASQSILGKYDVDVLFNNAGYGMKAKFEDMTENAMKRSIDTNVLGMIRVTQQFIPFFKRKKGGLILTTTSLAGEMGLVMDGVYAADKWAVTGMCEMLYFELAPYHIRVKTIVPGVVQTGFKMDGGGATPEEYEEIIGRQVEFLMPGGDHTQMETAQEAAQDIWDAVNDPDDDRMCYVTGKRAKEIYAKRQTMGDEDFRRYYRSLILGRQGEQY
ncbi:SDR family NAD(P)-dependent oxidoreductase [uncultured Propionibacterium sp.]|uniref:SDR family NAD(P)-dependent oxidoreductase n=1 Tax=uncultured Propionibacterium sp. TaxID=218066 RepID=UPI00292E7CFB|nr:SDR family NAD(P)-dependent oxidoreductase [uncultured Propionibacterium sp.]